jgi:endonuclease-3
MMKKIEKAQKIQAILEECFPSPDIPLIHSSPYTLLIAVLLSAQCTDKRVNEVTPKLFSKADTPQAMILLSLPEIEQIIKPCGLYKNKAKAIKGLSNQLIERFNGEVPSHLQDLESLPGVGHKTASVVMVQAFGKPAFPVDTHIHRCAKRWGLSKGKNVEETEKDLKKLFPKDLWGKVHLQMIYYARKYCPSRGHSEKNCPICDFLTRLKHVPSTAP